MKSLVPYSKSVVTFMLVIPVLAWCYIGLFLTMSLWYPAGLTIINWQSHLLHFSIVYLMWLIVFFSYRLFDWDVLRSIRSVLGRIFVSLVICSALGALYFYFQPALLITPRRFLLAHVFITGLGIIFWYLLMRRAVISNRKRKVYVHSSHLTNDIQQLIKDHSLMGLEFAGSLSGETNLAHGSILVVPTRGEINAEDSKTLFAVRNQGVQFVEFYELYENLTRSVHLSVLSDTWLILSINYYSHQLFDVLKRVIDLSFGLLGSLVFLVSYPVIGLLVKTTSHGPILFSQPRVGQNGKVFTLYKYRTMNSASANNTWTALGDSRITKLGSILRSLRIDELPQSLNILKGDMSIVGPRPEQVNIVKELEVEIPYYNERHAVKPGLTGWAQLHVYAGSLEETKKKLQYDLYYIKHRSLLFDAEIIIKTFYNVITFSGR